MTPSLTVPFETTDPPTYVWPPFAATNVPAPSLTSFICPANATDEFSTVSSLATSTCSSPPVVVSVIVPSPSNEAMRSV